MACSDSGSRGAGNCGNGKLAEPAGVGPAKSPPVACIAAVPIAAAASDANANRRPVPPPAVSPKSRAARAGKATPGGTGPAYESPARSNAPVDGSARTAPDRCAAGTPSAHAASAAAPAGPDHCERALRLRCRLEGGCGGAALDHRIRGRHLAEKRESRSRYGRGNCLFELHDRATSLVFRSPPFWPLAEQVWRQSFLFG
jgi:hypothetical protein